MKYLFILPLLFIFSFSFAQTETGKYHRVKVYTGESGLKQLAQMGIPVDHGEVKKGVWFISDFSERDLQKIKNSGLQYKILIEDVSAYYQNQNEPSSAVPLKKNAAGCSAGGSDYTVPVNFTLGSMGGYFKYNEMLVHLDSMFAKYPSIITQRQQIDTFLSIQGRPIYWLKISDNPGMDENEPEVFYNTLAHAREAAGLSAVIFFMWYVLENYGTDPLITYLVDNTEMYFVPCVNPDGYIYNETTNPSGGGMWRKNRRNNGDGTYGVDLNRNFGFLWGYDDSGSSPNTSDDTYRGTAPFSEPETGALKYFCENRQFKLALNYHTYGNYLIYPWGYIPALTPDSGIYIGIAQLLTQENNYTYGTGYQTVGYGTNGDSDDWMYGEQSSKGKILSMTPEAGTGGFWPSSSSIIGICKDNLLQNILLATVAGKYATVEDRSPATVTQLTGYFYFSLQCLGLDTPATFTVTYTPISTKLTINTPLLQYTGLNLQETRDDSVSFTLNNITNGESFTFLVELSNGQVTWRDTVTKIYGQFSTLFAENGNNLSQWVNNGWGVSNSVYVTAPSSITDSPSGNYGNNENSSVKTTNPVDLSGAISAHLSFWSKWEIEAGWDYVQVSASADNGVSWTNLCGKYTKPGNSDQDPGEPLYDGYQTSWVFEEMELNDFVGQGILLRFRLISDNAVTYNGFFFDDLKVEIIPDSITGIRAAPLENSLSLYPNPARNNFVILTDGAETNSREIKLTIIDVFGNEILKSEIRNSPSEIYCGFLPPGIYFYRITSADGSIFRTGKLIIE